MIHSSNISSHSWSIRLLSFDPRFHTVLIEYHSKHCKRPLNLPHYPSSAAPMPKSIPSSILRRWEKRLRPRTRRWFSTPHPAPPQQSHSRLLALPDELLLDILSRVTSRCYSKPVQERLLRRTCSRFFNIIPADTAYASRPWKEKQQQLMDAEDFPEALFGHGRLPCYDCFRVKPRSKFNDDECPDMGSRYMEVRRCKKCRKSWDK